MNGRNPTKLRWQTVILQSKLNLESNSMDRFDAFPRPAAKIRETTRGQNFIPGSIKYATRAGNHSYAHRLTECNILSIYFILYLQEIRSVLGLGS